MRPALQDHRSTPTESAGGAQIGRGSLSLSNPVIRGPKTGPAAGEKWPHSDPSVVDPGYRTEKTTSRPWGREQEGFVATR